MIGEAFRYIKKNLLAFLFAIYAVGMVIPPFPFTTPIYYVLLGLLFLYMATRSGMSVNFYMLFFYGAAALSIVVGHPPTVFKSWARLGLFILVTGAAFCLFQSRDGDRTHFKILKITLWLFVLIGILSFFCYIVGINYMVSYASAEDSFNTAGAFGGLTQHSMVLGPLSTAGTIFLCSQLVFGRFRGYYKYIALGGLLLCFLSVMLSASRSATLTSLSGMLIVLFLRYHRNLGKFYQYIFLTIVCVACASPFLGHYSSGLEKKQQINEDRGGTFASRETKWNNRINEFESSPIFGIGFASISLNTAEGHARITRTTGVIEPGSSWLAFLSMTGLMGAVPIFLFIITTLGKLYKKNKRKISFTVTTLFALLATNVLHQFAEGFAISAGSYLCFEFWLLLGVCSAIGRKNYITEEL